ncbi:DUF1396 domain-containing protein [Streptosporangiaceae bacterium NEAU-GS5]|nr:DUF1396 domain-containing protein [Streptosporangiaceae bacterium NEAU-GS5]
MRRILIAAAALGGLVAIAGCGASGQGQEIQAKPMAATKALAQSAEKVNGVSSYSADLVLDFSDGQQGAGHVQGTMLYQKDPLSTDVNLSQVTYGGQAVPGGIRMITQGDIAYVKLDMLKTLVGATKPWIKLDLKQMAERGGVNVDQLIGQAKQLDLQTAVAMLTASKDVKPAGTESVGGVDTTHYTGTFPVDAALKMLDPATQDKVKGQLESVKDMKFDAWIDGQGLPRKIGLAGGDGQGTFKATMLFKAFNEQVSIETPPAGEVGEMPQNINMGN